MLLGGFGDLVLLIFLGEQRGGLPRGTPRTQNPQRGGQWKCPLPFLLPTPPDLVSFHSTCLCCSHTSLLMAPLTLQAHADLRAFALAAPSTWKALFPVV